MTKAQGMQKAKHDTKSKETRYMIGENVMATNFRNDPKWLPGRTIRNTHICRATGQWYVLEVACRSIALQS